MVGEKDSGQRPIQRTKRELSAVRMPAQREQHSVLFPLGECFRLMREQDRKRVRRSPTHCRIDIRRQPRRARSKVGDARDPDVFHGCSFVDQKANPAPAQPSDDFERLAVHLVIAEDGNQWQPRIEHVRRSKKLRREDRIVVDVVAGKEDDVRLLRCGGSEDRLQPRGA